MRCRPSPTSPASTKILAPAPTPTFPAPSNTRQRRRTPNIPASTDIHLQGKSAVHKQELRADRNLPKQQLVRTWPERAPVTQTRTAMTVKRSRTSLRFLLPAHSPPFRKLARRADEYLRNWWQVGREAIWFGHRAVPRRNATVDDTPLRHHRVMPVLPRVPPLR